MPVVIKDINHMNYFLIESVKELARVNFLTFIEFPTQWFYYLSKILDVFQDLGEEVNQVYSFFIAKISLCQSTMLISVQSKVHKSHCL